MKVPMFDIPTKKRRVVNTAKEVEKAEPMVKPMCRIRENSRAVFLPHLGVDTTHAECLT